ncbi:hypothetical protein [Phenylobacterium sp.]|uniref:hypothetical protein n=1 Tax=Phenylobacterium sp. TaxID=1871053 RepID=UPI0035B0112E
MRQLPGRSFAAQLRHFKRERVEKLPAEIVARTVREFAQSLVTDWTPYGQPEFWKAPPPADYRPGNLQSSWFLSIGAPTAETTTATDHREAHNLGLLQDFRAGPSVYLCNSAPHASAIEHAHSWQAPNGLMVNAHEFEGIAYTVARGLSQ